MLNLYFKFGKVACRLVLLLYLFSGYASKASEIPRKINFAGIELIFDEAMLKQISREAYKIEQAPEKLQLAYENFKVYEKLIKQQLTKQGLPEDFVYLALSLSQMNPSFEDESTAGFWALPLPDQEGTSLYKVNGLVDERFHPHIATTQVANVIKKYHTITNWFYAMLAYKIGLEAAQNQAKLMNAQLPKYEQGLIDQRLHIYGNYADPFLVKLFALKILIDERASKDQQVSNKGTLMQSDVQAISLRKLSKYLGVHEDEIRAYNPWIKSNQIPGDKTYIVFHLNKQEQPVIVTNDLAPKPEDKVVDNSQLTGQNSATSYVQNQANVKKQTIMVDSIIYNPALTTQQTSSSGTNFTNLHPTHLEKSSNYLSPLIHIVQQGESLYSIAKTYQVSVDNLQLWNHLDDYLLLSDDRIMVSTPDMSNFQQSQQTYRWLTHTVGKGENLTKIAKNYQTSVATLSQINQLPDPNQIVFGQRLIVPVSLKYTSSPVFKKGRQR